MRHPDHTVDPALVEHLSTLVADGQMDRYPLLGEGLSGKVYEFEHYAVKVFKADAGERQDASLLSLLSDHAAFPRVHYREEGWMMMDKVNGYTLGEVIQGGEKLKEHLYTQIEEAVEHCYAKGLIPDDLHLNNIMVDHEGRIKIVDVGRFFHTERAAAHKEALAEDLETLKYCGLFRFFSSSKRKKKRHWFSSDHRRRRSHSGSSPRRYSSSERRWRRRRSSW
ncbi:MAG: protein kinase domain-containing protein [Planifilum sp.]|jgi:RIO-like serine/threonine protein kinase